MSRKRCVLGLSTLFLCLLACRAPDTSAPTNASIKGGAADPYWRLRQSASFLGEDYQITYCIGDTSSTRLTSEQIVAETERAFATWSSFIQGTLMAKEAVAQISVIKEFRFPVKMPLLVADCEAADVVYTSGPVTDQTVEILEDGVAPSMGATRKFTLDISSQVQKRQRSFIWLAGSKNSRYRQHDPQRYTSWIEYDDPYEVSLVILQHWGYLFGNFDIPTSAASELDVIKRVHALRQVSDPVQRHLLFDQFYQIEPEGRLTIQAYEDRPGDFGEHRGVCELGFPAAQQVFVRAVPKGAASCFILEPSH